MSAGPSPAGALRWAVLQHVGHEGPGLVEPALRSAGCSVEVVRLDLGEPVPAIGSIDGLVVMGGPMSVHDVDPWLAPERALLADAVGAGLPVLGICLGAQQLAAALGAEVAPGPEEEVGTGWVELTGPGRRDPVLGPEHSGLAGTGLPCVHWHRETFTLPDGAVHLAATPSFPHQAFRVGERAYGLQFHVEVDSALADGWRPLLREGAPFAASDLARVEVVGSRVLQRFVAVATRGVATGAATATVGGAG